MNCDDYTELDESCLESKPARPCFHVMMVGLGRSEGRDLMGVENIPVGPEMFEKWAGPKWGLRIWRIFFGLVVFAMVGGILFGAWKVGREIFRGDEPIPQIVKVPVADPKQAQEIKSLQDQLRAMTKPTVAIPPKKKDVVGNSIQHPKGNPQLRPPPRVQNNMGPVTNNSGIVTQGQTGDNSQQ